MSILKEFIQYGYDYRFHKTERFVKTKSKKFMGFAYSKEHKIERESVAYNDFAFCPGDNYVIALPVSEECNTKKSNSFEMKLLARLKELVDNFNAKFGQEAHISKQSNNKFIIHFN